jgi:hypothetical protein
LRVEEHAGIFSSDPLVLSIWPNRRDLREFFGARLWATPQPQHADQLQRFSAAEALRLVLRTQPRSFDCGFAALGHPWFLNGRI